MLQYYRNQLIDLLYNSIDWFLYDGNTYTHAKIKIYVRNQAFHTILNTYFKGKCRTFFLCLKCDALGDLGPFVQFKKGEKHAWRSVIFSKAACIITKSKTRPWLFSRF